MPTKCQLTFPTINKAYHFHPSQLTGKDRYKHVVKALKAYNAGIIRDNPEGANAKFKKLRMSPFVFMRGTADLMYRDFLGTDADKFMVLCNGYVHLENYGVMETDKGSLIWGLNDFDESYFAPFIWDVKRGATSVVMAATDTGRKKMFGEKRAKSLAFSFAEAYLATVLESMENKNFQLVLNKENSPDLIKDLLRSAARIKGKKWLKDNYLDPKSSKPRFKNTDEIQRINAKKVQPQIQRSLNKYLQSLLSRGKKVPGKIKVWDVATKTGSGTGSIGLWRYYALVEATGKYHEGLLILEIKQDRKSVLEPYIEEGLLTFQSDGSRVAYAEDLQLPHANPFYGYTKIGKKNYLVRERSPHKKRVVLDKLKKYRSFEIYAQACGKALALSHLHSGSVLKKNYPNFAEAILHSVSPEAFSIDISGFAFKLADRVKSDWQFFNQAFKKGEFNF